MTQEISNQEFAMVGDSLEGFDTFNRFQKAVILILYRCYPDSMSVDEIANAITSEGLLSMTDEEFDNFRINLVEYKKYIKE